jgi:glycosyltransferase involved in cell wall biosynthesis
MNPFGARRARVGGVTDDSPTVAILVWGDLLTDWLDGLGVSLEEFRDQFVGSWMFGYAEALRRSGVRTVIIGVTSGVRQTMHWTHRPSGIPLYVLPAPAISRIARPAMLDRPLEGRRDPVSLARAAITHIEPYFATPAFRIARVLRAERCRALLCQEYETPRFDVSVAIGRALRVPVFATFQGGDYQRSVLERPLRPITLRLARALIVASGSEEARLRARYRLPQARIARVLNPIDLEFWRREDTGDARAVEDIDREAEVVAWHGQVHARKGLDLLFDAWELVCSTRQERKLQLLLFGARRGSEWIRSEIERRNLPAVRLIDEWILDPARVRRLLSCAEVYAFPSRHEGLAVAPIEAMACGLPLVATDAQGVAELAGDGEADGAIVVGRDDAAAFARGLGLLLDDPALRSDYGARARRRVERSFGMDPVGRELRGILIAGGEAKL